MQQRPSRPKPEKDSAARIAALSPEKRALLRKRGAQPSINGEALVAECLNRLGITHVYSVSGTPIDAILPALIRHRIRVIGVHHQQAAVCMAAAQNYVAGELTATVIVSAGPAVTNTTTGILVAHDNDWPVPILAGRRPLRGRGMGYFQELDAVPVFERITKWSATVPATDAIPEFLERAFRRSMCSRPGPTFVELPEDILVNQITKPDLALLSSSTASPQACDEELVRETIHLLDRAERPLMILGKGVRWSVPSDLLRQLVERWNIPFITSPMGRGFIPDDHPLCCNGIRAFVQSRADVVLVIAARLNWIFRYGSEWANAKIIGLSAMELETCVRHKIPIIVIVANNHGLCGSLKQKGAYPRDYPERVTMFEHGIRYEEIAQTLGCHGEFVEQPDEFRPAFEHAARSGRAACINVFIDPDAPMSGAWENTMVDMSTTGD
jgi:thiamine pyrophosphate-dependent acetolactate synthase large subunit-like protein